MRPERETQHRRYAPLAATTLAASFALLLGVTGVSARQDEPQEPAKRGTAGRVYKNLKILRDLPQEKFLPLMLEWNEAMGVQCVFCHIEDKAADGTTNINYESEANPHKEISREMYRMTQELNAKWKAMDNHATCFMCHQGRIKPVVKKLAAPPGPPPAEAKKPAAPAKKASPKKAPPKKRR